MGVLQQKAREITVKEPYPQLQDISTLEETDLKLINEDAVYYASLLEKRPVF